MVVARCHSRRASCPVGSWVGAGRCHSRSSQGVSGILLGGCYRFPTRPLLSCQVGTTGDINTPCLLTWSVQVSYRALFTSVEGCQDGPYRRPLVSEVSWQAGSAVAPGLTLRRHYPTPSPSPFNTPSSGTAPQRHPGTCLSQGRGVSGGGGWVRPRHLHVPPPTVCNVSPDDYMLATRAPPPAPSLQGHLRKVKTARQMFPGEPGM